jgi:hypothetical protein
MTTVPSLVGSPLRWIAPDRVAPGDRHPYVPRTSEPLRRAVRHVVQDGRLLHHEDLRGAFPNRTPPLTARRTQRVEVKGGAGRVTLDGPQSSFR